MNAYQRKENLPHQKRMLLSLLLEVYMLVCISGRTSIGTLADPGQGGIDTVIILPIIPKNANFPKFRLYLSCAHSFWL